MLRVNSYRFTLVSYPIDPQNTSLPFSLNRDTIHFVDEFISEKIKPVQATFDAQRMAGGEPGLPKQFYWRKKLITAGPILKTWKTTTSCRHGSREQYVRKHWYEVQTDAGIMKIYFDKGLLGDRKNMGWWLYSVLELGSKV